MSFRVSKLLVNTINKLSYIRLMHINDIDLNLLRLFNAVYGARNVSRAAEQLGMTQSATSQGLTRLRLLLQDALFVRASGGVAPTPRAVRLASAVKDALGLMEIALNEAEQFDPKTSRKIFKLHVSDIGELRLLPGLMKALRRQAPSVGVETLSLPHTDIADALDAGRIDCAFGFLPQVKDTQHQRILDDCYVLLLRKNHPFIKTNKKISALDKLQQLEFAAVRSHSDTLRILQLLQLEGRLRLTAANFLSLPPVVKDSNLGLLIPRSIAMDFHIQGGYAIVEPQFPLRDFTVSLHWSRRFEADPALGWFRNLVATLFITADKTTVSRVN